MKVLPKDRVIYTFSREHPPAAHVDPGELILLEADDALGGQIRDESTPPGALDWSKVDQATGPVYIRGAEKGDTVMIDILDIEVVDRGVILVIPGAGALADKEFRPQAKMVDIHQGVAVFNDVKLKVQPIIGTIGVAPYGDPISSAIPHKHGGNLDCTEITKGARLYLPVATDGALFAAGDLHGVQADGELCVSSIEIAGKMLFKFGVIKGRQAEWPIVETRDHFSILTADESLDKAVRIATEKAVQALMAAQQWSFEEAYMFSSLGVQVAINQVVDPKRGCRAMISKDVVTPEALLT